MYSDQMTAGGATVAYPFLPNLTGSVANLFYSEDPANQKIKLLEMTIALYQYTNESVTVQREKINGEGIKKSLKKHC